MRAILLFLVFGLAPQSEALEWIAHRANACGAMENSLAAVEAAWSVGATMVELDVRVSKDGIVYLFHDARFQGRLVDDLSYAEVVEMAGDAAVPTLTEVLAIEARAGTFLLDLKNVTQSTVGTLVDSVRRAPGAEMNIAFQDEDARVLAALRERLPGSRYVYLFRLERSLPFLRPPSPEHLLETIAAFGFDAVNLKGRRFLDRAYIQALKNATLDVYVWTINSIARASFYVQIGVDGIVTDDVLGLKRVLSKAGSVQEACLPSEQEPVDRSSQQK